MKHLFNEEDLRRIREAQQKKETYTKEEVEKIVQMIIHSFVTGFILGETIKRGFKEK